MSKVKDIIENLTKIIKQVGNLKDPMPTRNGNGAKGGQIRCVPPPLFKKPMRHEVEDQKYRI